MRHPWQFLKACLSLNPWHLMETPLLTHEFFFSPQVSPDESARHFARLQPESFMMVLETLLLDLPRPAKVKTPVIVMAAANDRVFTIAEQQATARAYKSDAIIIPNLAHDMMLEPTGRLWLTEC
jgi:pimeloyl-ACP methyl ester carboxylesterase